MKKMYKIITVFALMLMLFSTINLVYADTVDKKFDIWRVAKDFIETGRNPGMLDESNKFMQGLLIDTNYRFKEIISFLWGIGLLVIFISTVVLGIRYMFVSPQEKSKIKQITMPYIVGVVIIFGALTIWKLVILVLDGSLNAI